MRTLTPQACRECGTDAAFIRDSVGAAICRTCQHEHPMDATRLGEGGRFEWVGGEHGWPAVLYAA